MVHATQQRMRAGRRMPMMMMMCPQAILGRQARHCVGSWGKSWCRPGDCDNERWREMKRKMGEVDIERIKKKEAKGGQLLMCAAYISASRRARPP